MRRQTLAWLLAAPAFCGCGGETKVDFTSVSKPPTVRVVQPLVRDIYRTVGQPSFIESYERTSIYPKLTGYIDKWSVDIGDRVKKGDVLATLFVPELVEDFGTKKADVALDKERIELAGKMVDVALADVKAAEAGVAEAQSILGKYDAEVKRWESEVKRLDQEVAKGVVSPQVLLESQNQLRSSSASKEAAAATIRKAEADLNSRQAAAAKARVDVGVATAALSVAESESRRLQAWIGYLTLAAPYDGIITVRNANTFDFVLPSTGDPTAMNRSPDLSPGKGAAPIYVVDRLDIVRVFVDIPEEDANFVQKGSKASVLVKAFRDKPIEGTVTRTSWALNIKSRTLRAEVDLPNPGSLLLPGMYAYAKVIIERPKVLSLPVAALAYSGDKTYCWRNRDNKAYRVEIQTGVSDGGFIEVTNIQAPATSTATESWTPVDGSEQVILGDLSILADGGPVEVIAPKDETKTAATTPPPVEHGKMALPRSLSRTP